MPKEPNSPFSDYVHRAIESRLMAQDHFIARYLTATGARVDGYA
jgi:hypothetical protein